MRINARLPSVRMIIAVALLLPIVAANAVSDCSENGRQNQRQELPEVISRQLPEDVGVESKVEVNLRGNGGILVVAIVLPTWYYSAEYCHGEKRNSDAKRALYVWRINASELVQVGVNNKIVWPISMVGNADVELIPRDDGFVLHQQTTPIRTYIYDHSAFQFEERTSRMRAVTRANGNVYSPMGSGGEYPGVDDPYDQGGDNSGSVSDQDGYEFSVDFLSGFETLKEYVFGKSVVERYAKVSVEPVYLEDLDFIEGHQKTPGGIRVDACRVP